MGLPVRRVGMLGKRWPIERIARIAADKPGREILLHDYALDPEDVEQAVTWAKAAEDLVTQSPDDAAAGPR